MLFLGFPVGAHPLLPVATVPWDVTSWSFGQWITTFGVVSGLVTIYLTFRRDKNADSTGKSNVKMQLDKMIDDRVERQLTTAWDQIESQGRKIESIERQLGEKTKENRRIREAVKRVFTTLFDWNAGGRRGEMPMPDREDLDLLEIEGIVPESTLQPGEIPRLGE